MTNQEKFNEHISLEKECFKNGLFKTINFSVYDREKLKYSDNKNERILAVALSYVFHLEDKLLKIELDKLLKIGGTK